MAPVIQTPPAHPRIYHILHVDRLASVAADGFLRCDAVMSERADSGSSIGMAGIKSRRLSLPVKCHPDLTVGRCVPFYFCPRSVMLYLIFKGNHPNLAYRGGQGPIVHLEADFDAAVAWAEDQGLRWAFTSSNAGSFYCEFFSDPNQLAQVNWEAVAATDWSAAPVKEAKQAEFLLESRFPWPLVKTLGVQSSQTYELVAKALDGTAHRPVIQVRRDWYYSS